MVFYTVSFRIDAGYLLNRRHQAIPYRNLLANSEQAEEVALPDIPFEDRLFPDTTCTQRDVCKRTMKY